MSKSSSKPKHKSKSKSKSTTSSKGPPLFYEFGRKAKGFLFNCSPDFCVFRFLHRKNPVPVTGTLSMKFLSTTKTAASFSLLEYKSGKSPATNVSATVDSASIAVGVEAEYKTASSTFSKCSAGISMKSLNSDASIILANKEKKSAAAVEFTKNHSKKRSTLTVGGSWAVAHQTVVKARLDVRGDVKTVLQYSIRPKSCLSFPGEFNVKELDKIPKVRMALSLAL
nr:mitochondrial outer membrane protein porin 5-like [Malus domestica]